MNAQELYEKVYSMLRTGKQPSLPFIVQESGGKKEVIWFYYSAKADGQDLLLSIRQVITADESLQVEIRPADIKIRKEVREFLRTHMELADYYEQLVQLYEAFDAEKMKVLLESAEAAPLLEAYEKVAELVKEQEADASQDEEPEKDENPEILMTGAAEHDKN